MTLGVYVPIGSVGKVVDGSLQQTFFNMASNSCGGRYWELTVLVTIVVVEDVGHGHSDVGSIYLIVYTQLQLTIDF